MVTKTLGVLRGGNKDYYERSLKEGGEIISHIFENLNDRWKVLDILIDKNGVWHIGGLPIVPATLPAKVDVVWNTTHPDYSKILEDLGISYFGQNHFNKIFESKDLLRKHMEELDIKTPKSILIPVYQEDFDGSIEDFLVNKAKEVHSKFSAPWIVKTFNNDPSVGIHIAKTFPELIDAIYDCAKNGDSILVEEFIIGRNFSLHLIPKFRNEDIYCFPIIEKKDEKIIKLGKFLKGEKENIIESAKKIFYHTKANKYLKLDIIVHPRQGIYLTHVGFSPKLNSNSCFYHSCENVGVSINDVINHILEGI